MKSSVPVLGVSLGAFLAGCDDKSKPIAASGPLYQSHFIGMAQLDQSTNAPKLKEVWALPSSEALRKQALEKIAKTPFTLWQKSLPSGATDRPELIRPLLDDLLSAESFVELN